MSDEQQSDDEDREQLISMPDAAERYGFNRKYLAQLASKGRLRAKKIGGIWLSTVGDVEDYIKSRKTTGAYRDDIQLDD